APPELPHPSVASGTPRTVAERWDTAIMVSAANRSLQLCPNTFNEAEETTYPRASMGESSTPAVVGPWTYHPPAQPPPNLYTGRRFHPRGGFHGSGSVSPGACNTAVS